MARAARPPAAARARPLPPARRPADPPFPRTPHPAPLPSRLVRRAPRRRCVARAVQIGDGVRSRRAWSGLM